MSELKWDLDELVKKVMDDLRKSSVDSNAANTAASEVSAALSRDFSSVRAKSAEVVNERQVEETTSDDVFIVSERVLTADVVKRLAANAPSRRWNVQKNAVVTPSAKDELKKLGVKLIVTSSDAVVSTTYSNSVAHSSRVTFSASNAAYGDYVGMRTQNVASKEFKRELDAQSVKSARVLIATHLPDAEAFPRSAREYLTRNAETTEIRLSCLKETSKRIAEEIANDKSLKVVLATHDAAIGAIWTNRLSGVRAVVAYTFEQAKRDLTATNANVLIVDPRDVGPYPLRQIVDYFLR